MDNKKNLKKDKSSKKSQRPQGPNYTFKLFGILKDYKPQIIGLLIFSLLSNGTNLVIPQIIAKAIDTFTAESFDINSTLLYFSIASIGIFIFTFIQTIFQNYASEAVARDLRNRVVEKISKLSYLKVQELTPSTLLTNLTSDIDAIKTFVAQGIVFLFSSIVLIIGASGLLISINWKLALAVLAVLPLILVAFTLIFRNIGSLFESSQKSIDWLNKVISESIIASSLVRVLNSQSYELIKFEEANENAKNIGLSILKVFASIFPIVNFVANLTIIIILALGGYFVLGGEMTIGQFSAFLQYVSILIFPIIVLGFLSNLIARASASFGRISAVLDSEEDQHGGEVEAEINGEIEFKDVNLDLANRGVLKNISFKIPAHSRTAILGPTAAGKTQIFYLLAKLLPPKSGEILIDGKKIEEYSNPSFYKQIGLVFQDSVIFNTTIRENILFREKNDAKNQILNNSSSSTQNFQDDKSNSSIDNNLDKAIETSELEDFIKSLPEGLETIVSERGASLSGGQKQRLTLARALSLNPKVLLLDDFTARVDNNTEKRIFSNLQKNYPGLTQILITQKISSVMDFDKIILMMEGEIVAEGTHEELMKSSLEYQQIYASQQSTEKENGE